jgi:hypothetical protein
MIKQYEYISALKCEIDRLLSDFLEKTSILETSILDNFELVPKKREESLDVNLSDPVREGTKKQWEMIAPVFKEYQKSVKNLLETPCHNKKQMVVLANIRDAFFNSEANVLLSQRIGNKP